MCPCLLSLMLVIYGHCMIICPCTTLTAKTRYNIPRIVFVFDMTDIFQEKYLIVLLYYRTFQVKQIISLLCNIQPIQTSLKILPLKCSTVQLTAQVFQIIQYFCIKMKVLPSIQFKEMLNKENFESVFFEYQLPKPQKDFYSKQYSKNNDLRLLVQIATHSSLRMFTDAKTGVLHFTCKTKGQACFDVEAYYHQQHQGYYFDTDLTTLTHNNKGCALDGASFRYLEIYNLLKLKKDLIERFMVEHQLMEQSPSLILSQLSNDQEQYFFEKYINYQVEARRKLRKRFDNVVNIDIKKIGKSQEVQVQKENTVKTKKEKQSNSSKTTKKEKEVAKKKTKEPEPLIQEEIKNKQQIYEQSGDQELEQKHVNEQIMETPVVKDSQQRISEEIADIMDSALQVYNRFTNAAKKKFIAKTTKKKSKKNKFSRTLTQKKAEDPRQSIILLPDDHSQAEEYFIKSEPPESLAELKMLNEQAEYLWSSSESAVSESNYRPLECLMEINKEDYFKSLRNSTLKKSLQKESLTSFLFSDPFGKQNI